MAYKIRSSRLAILQGETNVHKNFQVPDQLPYTMTNDLYLEILVIAGFS